MDISKYGLAGTVPKLRLHDVWEIGLTALKLGLTSFGGPIAHLGYFREEYVRKRKWLDEHEYADLVALCQFLPGPASSQVGIGVGWLRGGLAGAVAAWIGFTLPSALFMALFAYAYGKFNLEGAAWIHGLKLAAVAIVAQAVWGMGKSLAPDKSRATMAIGAAVIALLWSSPWSQIAIIAAGGVSGLLLFKSGPAAETAAAVNPRPSAKTAGFLILFAGIFLLLPLARMLYASDWLALAESMYRSGSLVFGGGHVVLPLLEREAVPAGWLDHERFIAGYAAAQAVPGPLFTFAAYIGFAAKGWLGAAVATAAIFLPAFLLVTGALPFWNRIRDYASVKQALLGVNAAVVGILLAALYDPVWTSAVHSTGDFCMTVLLFGALVYWKMPPWIVVLAAAAGGFLLV